MEIQVHSSVAALNADQWNRLGGATQPFLRHEFLLALENHGVVGGASGWTPAIVTASRRGSLLGALVMYRKMHSYGEFVFDWAWAHAYERAGVPYYPKLVVAVPYSPVTGKRILLADLPDPETIADRLITGAIAYAREQRCSSLHFLFTDREDTGHLARNGLMLRTGCQFHWRNHGYRDFEEFLARLNSRHRKKIRHERRAVRDAGIETEVIPGDRADAADWRHFHRCYLHTFEKKLNHAPMPLAFFMEIGARLGGQVVLIQARRGTEPVASAIFYRDEENLYGRHWGGLVDVECLHFELCYYRAIDYCIAHGLQRFEAGAQGEYKVWRGFYPSETRSMHWVGHPQFARAIDDFLCEERRQMTDYLEDLTAHLPYRIRAGEAI